ncbi:MULTISPECIES: gluconokinase [Actinoalloteichus]|uniref:Gluconokinase n=1 Tax=Actinoalloteichus fjordicus TaxID=1612552 RepID=A0AAC9PRC5_9PSEU|nr:MULTISPECIES: gluconokinase [Actinoalloteichus]APU13822.1 carbohydrate kinase, thermoresistant glucokinase family [Actinoalloteichus fjordicus]APU19768.1 carbohydrate kinase, thermoresistant glucokinase family [Actinoalloteichus sp. GBA129-24]
MSARERSSTIVVVMGVSGSGKTTIARSLAERLGVTYSEADEFHPPENIAKMESGVPLNDEDRLPWLRSIAAWISEQERADVSGVVTCSALKRSYRDLLRTGNDGVWFLHLAGSREVISDRLAGRTGHFMPASLLDSQFADLEPLESDEVGYTADVSEDAEVIVDRSLAALKAAGRREADLT